MSAAENIVSGVIVISVFLVLGIIIYSSTTGYMVDEYKRERQEHLHDLYSTNFNTVLRLSEPTSKQTMANLLADAIYYRKEVLNYTNATVNVTGEFQKRLDQVYGKGRYYLSLKPKEVDVSLNFVIDGSNSLQQERITLASELPEILRKITAKVNETGNEVVIANIYILGDRMNDRKKCNVFPTLRADVLCSIIGPDEIYYEEELDTTEVSFDSNDTMAYKKLFNITPPYQNRSVVESIRKPGGIKDYYESDWAAGAAYASAVNKGKAKLVIIFPVGDELSTSSISQTCFDTTNPQRQKVCDICTASCGAGDTETELRSLNSINKALPVIKENNHIVNPIFAYSCDYDFKQVFNAYYEEVYGNPTIMACQESNCLGCSVDVGVCFHSECKDTIIEQMTYFASETDGEVIDLQQISQLSYNVQDRIDENIDQYHISVGEYRDTERYAIERQIPLPNKLMTSVRVFVYPEVPV